MTARPATRSRRRLLELTEREGRHFLCRPSLAAVAGSTAQERSGGVDCGKEKAR